MREEAILIKMEYGHVVQKVVLPEGAVRAITWTDWAGQWHISAPRASTIRGLLVIHPAHSDIHSPMLSICCESSCSG